MSRVITKTVLLGDECKSDYRRLFFGDGFDFEHVDMLGAQHSIKQINVDDISLEHQIWEISAERKFELIRKNFFQGIASLILIIDEISQSKLESMRNWFEEMSLVINSEINIVVIVNNGDCNHIQCVKSINAFCSDIKTDYGLSFSTINCFCSSLETGKNIENTFEFLSAEVLKSIQEYN